MKRSFKFSLSQILFTLGFIISTSVTAQVGVGTATPQGALDIVSTNTGVLLPRVALLSNIDVLSVINPTLSPLVDGTTVWNLGTAGLTPAGYYYWQGGRWNLMSSDAQPQVHYGKFIINAAGIITITGVPFTPRTIEFTAINRAQSYNATYRSGSNNTNDIRMAGGHTIGYAQNNSGSIVQQVISNAFSGSSLNNIGTYSSDAYCLAAYFVNNNGEPIHDNGSATGGTDIQDGLIRASLITFNSNGFTLNVDRFLNPLGAGLGNEIVVIYKAYR